MQLANYTSDVSEMSRACSSFDNLVFVFERKSISLVDCGHPVYGCLPLNETSPPEGWAGLASFIYLYSRSRELVWECYLNVGDCHEEPREVDILQKNKKQRI